MSNDSIWKSNSCKFCSVFVFDMASLTGEKRKIQSHTIVEPDPFANLHETLHELKQCDENVAPEAYNTPL